MSDLASSSTLCQFENGIDREAIGKMNALLLDVFIEHRQGKPPKEIDYIVGMAKNNQLMIAAKSAIAKARDEHEASGAALAQETMGFWVTPPKIQRMTAKQTKFTRD